MTCIQTCKVKTLTASADDLDVQAMAFVPDGRLAVGLTGEVAVCAVDVSSGTLRALHVFSTEKHAVRSLAWSTDGVFLAAGDDFGVVHVWKQETHGSGMQLAAKRQEAEWVECT
jgi:WD40 repeat protein